MTPILDEKLFKIRQKTYVIIQKDIDTLYTEIV